VGSRLCQKLREEVQGRGEGRGGQMAAKLQCKEDGVSCYEPPLPPLMVKKHSSTEDRVEAAAHVEPIAMSCEGWGVHQGFHAEWGVVTAASRR
jgi:hypothetical protein